MQPQEDRLARWFHLVRKPGFRHMVGDPDYVTCRLEPFINFFQDAHGQDRRNDSLLTYPIIIFGALIAVVNVYSVGGGQAIPFGVAILSAIFGALVSILTGISQYEKYHQRWAQEKLVAARLRNEYYLWKNRVGDYRCKPEDNPPAMIPTARSIYWLRIVNT
jgi:hypothetical protein